MDLSSKTSPFCFVCWYFYCLKFKTINISILIVNTAQEKKNRFSVPITAESFEKKSNEALVRVLPVTSLKDVIVSHILPWHERIQLLRRYLYPVLAKYTLTQHFRAATDNNSPVWYHQNIFTWKISNLVRCIGKLTPAAEIFLLSL